MTEAGATTTEMRPEVWCFQVIAMGLAPELCFVAPAAFYRPISSSFPSMRNVDRVRFETGVNIAIVACNRSR